MAMTAVRAGRVGARPPLRRWLALLALLLGEGLALGIAFDGDALEALPPGWWTPLLRFAGAVMPASAALLGALVLVGWSRRDAIPFAPDQARRYLPALLIHAASFAVLLLVSRRLFARGDADRTARDLDLHRLAEPGRLIAAWLLAVAVTVVSWLATVLPLRVVLARARARARLLVASAVLGLLAFAVGRLAQGLWLPMRQVTFSAVSFVLSRLSPHAISQPDALILGVDSFLVQIAPACSGYEGIGLTWAFVLAALWLFRARWRFPAAALLLVPATVLPFAANIVRIVTLVLLGAHVSPALAEGGFHSYAGSILFCVVALGIVALGLGSPHLTRAEILSTPPTTPPTPTEATASPAPFLVPFLAMTAAGLVARAFSAGDDEPLFALRPLAGLLALLWFRGRYATLGGRQSPSLLAVAGGLAVAALWLVFERYVTSTAPAAGVPAMAGIAVRAASAIVLVPVVEELAFRGFLARRIGAADFDGVPAAGLPWRGVIISAIAFGLLHRRPEAGIAAGLVYGIVYRRRGALIDAVAAHAATNAALVVVALATRRWDLWT